MDRKSKPEASDVETEEAPVQPSTSYSVSGGFLRRLENTGLSIGFTSYQSGALYLVGRNGTGGINIDHTAIPKPMGIAIQSDGGFVLAAGSQIIRFANNLAPEERANKIFDACYIPRTIHITGALDAHDVGLDVNGEPIFVNTQYNCLARMSNKHSFSSFWKPPFISQLVKEDRCHLNGMAMKDGHPAFVTAASRSDTIDGWRDRRDSGGVVIDVHKNEIVCSGLSMPHSPRWHEGKLWVLNSGAGELGYVDFDEVDDNGHGQFKPVMFCPGFLRGLSFHGRYAFVGLSKPRYKRFEGLALDQRLTDADSEPWCGIQVIDTEKRQCVDWLRIDGSVSEIYDVTTLPGVTCPMAVSANSKEAATLVTIEEDTK